MGFNDFRDVNPGEIVRLGDEGIDKVGQMKSKRKAHCAFEWMYTARPDSVIEGIEANEVRKRAGMYLARDDDIEAERSDRCPNQG